MNTQETIQQRIGLLLAQKERVLVAIDGNCTAGKSTLARNLAATFDCNVLHMDDFFLRPDQRTQTRYAETGGNVDYERFFAEVLLPLRGGKPFSYRPFDCKFLALSEPVVVTPKQLAIIEGSYSLHPYFGDPYDLKILLTVSPEVQHLRVLERPVFLHRRFFEEWIPMENRYLAEFHIAEKCDLVFSDTKSPVHF